MTGEKKPNEIPTKNVYKLALFSEKVATEFNITLKTCKISTGCL